MNAHHLPREPQTDNYRLWTITCTPKLYLGWSSRKQKLYAKVHSKKLVGSFSSAVTCIFAAEIVTKFYRCTNSDEKYANSLRLTVIKPLRWVHFIVKGITVLYLYISPAHLLTKKLHSLHRFMLHSNKIAERSKQRKHKHFAVYAAIAGRSCLLCLPLAKRCIYLQS